MTLLKKVTPDCLRVISIMNLTSLMTMALRRGDKGKRYDADELKSSNAHQQACTKTVLETGVKSQCIAMMYELSKINDCSIQYLSIKW